MAKTIGDLIIEYFKKHPKENLSHGPVVDWVEKEYLKLYGRKPRDTWRQIRKFHQGGILIKIKKGIYKYDPNYTMKVELFDFSPKMKEEIFRQDNYRCVVCERGRQDGIEICADHIKPKDKGGTNTVDNGQTLCMEHNLMKKNYSQTEAGKRYFIKMYEQAVSNNDGRMIDFCKCVFECYDKYGVNGHITRPYSKEE